MTTQTVLCSILICTAIIAQNEPEYIGTHTPGWHCVHQTSMHIPHDDETEDEYNKQYPGLIGKIRNNNAVTCGTC